MLRILWRLTRGSRLRPWRSPYLLWRIETYWGLHADRITFLQFWHFMWRERGNMVRYLHWAARHSKPITGRERDAPVSLRLAD